MITQDDLFCYVIKKKQLEDDMNRIKKSKGLKRRYKKAINLTDSCWNQYGIFHKNASELLSVLIAYFPTQAKALKSVMFTAHDNIYKLASMKNPDTKDKGELVEISNSAPRHNNNLNYSINANYILFDKADKSYNNLKSISDAYTEVLRAIIDMTVDVLFLYIYRMDIDNIRKDMVIAYVKFAVGLIPFIGQFISGFASFVDSLLARANKIANADDTESFLETYCEALRIWQAMTKCYVDCFINLKQLFGGEDR